MKKIIYVVILIALTSCNQNKSNKIIADHTTGDSIMAESYQTENDTIEPFQTQAEINEACYNEYVANEDSVEKEFRSYWKLYLSIGKSSKMRRSSGRSTRKRFMRCQYVKIMVVPHLCMLVQSSLRERKSEVCHSTTCTFTHKEKISYNKTTFTPTMIADAYSAYIMAVGEDEYIKQKTEYQESLRKEQICWDDLLECRKKTSLLLTDDIKKVYDISTNQMIRTKLYQLKNQNQDLGMISGEIMKCALPEDCSDKVLLDYPGFNKIWAKHCENLDWYPKFD